MADGFFLQIDADLAALIERRASEAGLSRDDLARQALEQALFRYEDYDWIGDDPRTPTPPSDPSAPTVPWEEVETRLRARLADRLAREKA